MAKIPFVTQFDFEHGRCDTLSPLIRRVIAPNPGPFTYTGTGVYIIGHGDVAVIDPGPVDERHIKALDAALEGEQISHIFVTHHHLDHTPLSRHLADQHGCKTYGFGAPQILAETGDARLEAGDDLEFHPDIKITDNQLFSSPGSQSGWTLRALHTPGHTSNHVCYALEEENTLFCGDHLMAWATSVVIPPDGHMGDYIAQLKRIRDMGFDRLWPTHGPSIDDPQTFIQAYIDHRMDREASILDLLQTEPRQIKDIIPLMYQDTDKRLYPAAALSVLAHMIHLVETDRVKCEGEPGMGNEYRLA